MASKSVSAPTFSKFAYACKGCGSNSTVAISRPGGRRAALALALAVTACGSSPSRASAPSGVLPAAAVTGLAVVTQPLTGRDVQKDSTVPDLAARLAGWVTSLAGSGPSRGSPGS